MGAQLSKLIHPVKSVSEYVQTDVEEKNDLQTPRIKIIKDSLLDPRSVTLEIKRTPIVIITNGETSGKTMYDTPKRDRRDLRIKMKDVEIPLEQEYLNEVVVYKIKEESIIMTSPSDPGSAKLQELETSEMLVVDSITKEGEGEDERVSRDEEKEIEDQIISYFKKKAEESNKDIGESDIDLNESFDLDDSIESTVQEGDDEKRSSTEEMCEISTDKEGEIEIKKLENEELSRKLVLNLDLTKTTPETIIKTKSGRTPLGSVSNNILPSEPWKSLDKERRKLGLENTPPQGKFLQEHMSDVHLSAPGKILYRASGVNNSVRKTRTGGLPLDEFPTTSSRMNPGKAWTRRGENWVSKENTPPQGKFLPEHLSDAHLSAPGKILYRASGVNNSVRKTTRWDSNATLNI